MIFRSLTVLAFISAALLTPGCAAFKQDVKSALDYAQLMCLLNTELTDVSEIKHACAIIDEFEDIVNHVLIQKAFARKASDCIESDRSK